MNWLYSCTLASKVIFGKYFTSDENKFVNINILRHLDLSTSGLTYDDQMIIWHE